jgi:Ca-activated chloride channel family protein
VRTEEFVNFFDYGYLPPVQETFKVYAECAPSRFGDGLHLMKIGVKGRRVGREEERGAVLTFLVDTSGSMDKPDRIGMIRKSLAMLVEKLGPADRVAIVQFDSQARLVLDHTLASEKKRILETINALQCSGSTHLEEGMVRAYEVAARHFRPGSENRVLILSDGVANLGTTTTEDILDKVETYRRQGIFCSVFGFGTGTYDDVTLETIANKGNGTYGFIDSEVEAKRMFVDDLAATLHTIAADVKIQVEFNPARVKQYRQLGYENRQLKKEDFRNDAVDAGEVGSGQSVTALYELSMAGAERDTIATVYIRYRRTDNGKVEEIQRRITQADVAPSFDRTDARFRLAACIAEFAEILRGSPHADGNSFERLVETLQPLAPEFSLDARVQELLRMVNSAGSLSRAP